MTTKLHSNSRMSQAVVHGGMVYLSGQIAVGEAIEEQTTAIFNSIDSLLAEAGSSKGFMISTTVWLTDMAAFAKFNALWESWLEDVVPPARAATQATLAAPQYLVEVAVIAACDKE